jgi:hypothetical protein
MKKIWDSKQEIIFSIVGLAFLYKSFHYLFILDDVKNSLFLFPAALLCFAYANLSKFKKFEGLGFKAELWENTQKEAERVLGQLKNILRISSAQIIETSVKSAYINNAVVWKKIWDLFNKLEGELKAIDLSENLNDTKKNIYGYFFWAVIRELARLNDKVIAEALKDHPSIEKPKFSTGDIKLLKYIEECEALKNNSEVSFDEQFIEQMKNLYREKQKGEFIVNDELIQLADAWLTKGH